MSFKYRAYDLIFEADEQLPPLLESRVSDDTPAEVTIVHEKVDMPSGGASFDEMTVVVQGDDVFLKIEESGVYRISGGTRISVDPEDGVEEGQVTIFLLGTVFGILLYQRGLLPLHCNAVEYEGRAFLFCGDSGAGKSTLAAYFQKRGYKLLTDDVCPIRFEPSGIVALPGIARLKLWQNSLDLFGMSSEGLRQLPWSMDKFELGVPSSDIGHARPVAAIYHLRDTNDGRPHGIHRLSGLGAANTVLANIYRRRVADLMGLGGFYLQMATRLMGSVPIFTVNRAWGLENFESEANLAEQHLISL